MKATLFLEDGSRYVGEAFGAHRDVVGELCVTTATVGGLELMTSPLCSGKLLLCTFPIAGGYGVIPEDFLTPEVHALALIVREACAHPSNYRSQGELGGFLKERGVPGLQGIDTRALTLRLRGAGAVRAALVMGEVDEASTSLEEIKNAPPPPALAAQRAELPGPGPHVAVADLGCGMTLAKALADRGARVSLLPLQEALALPCDAVALSDGPESQLPLLQPALPEKPLYGEGLGHLLIARARGGKIARMGAAHGGANLPMRWGERVYITSQFHTYDVREAPASAKRVYRNLNDGTTEGLGYPDALTLQFAPILAAGPHDMGFVYDEFLSLAKEGAHAAG